MMTRIAVIAVALLCSIVMYISQSISSPEDSPLMHDTSAKFGYWFADFLICLVAVGTLYLIGRGIFRGLMRLRR